MDFEGKDRRVKRILETYLGEKVENAVNQRCDAIEQYVKEYLTKNDKRETAIRQWLVNEVKFKMANDLFNATCTIDAAIKVLGRHAITIPDFEALVDAEKQVIAKERIAAAEAKLAASAAGPETKSE